MVPSGKFPSHVFKPSVDDNDAHASRRARDHAHRGFQRGRVEIGHLHFRDFLNLRLRDLGNLVLIGLGAAALDAARLLDENGCGRRLQNERKGTILINRDDDGDDKPFLTRGLRVEFLGKARNIDPVRAQRGAAV